MTEASRSPPRFVHLLLSRLAIALVVVGATIGIVAILSGRLSPTHGKIILSTFVGAFFLGTSLLSLSAEEVRPQLMSKLGLFISACGFLLFLYGVWAEGWQHVEFWKGLSVAVVLAVTCGQSAQLMLSPLQWPARGVVVIAQVAAWTCAGTLLFMIVAERGEPALWRALGVSALVDVSATAITSLLKRLQPPSD